MEATNEEIRQIIVQALIDSAPDQALAEDLIKNDPALFQKNTMRMVFETIGMESLGWLWFGTLLEEQLPAGAIGEMEVFFITNSDKYLDELIEQLKSNAISNE